MLPEKTKFEKFETKLINRKDVKNAPYNPRKIKKENKERLKDRIKDIGYLSPIVWNKRSGNIVSGHQRIKVLDSLEGSKDYSLTVSVVDLSDKDEKEQNLFFNNTSTQGEFDFDLMADLWDADQVDFLTAGFSEKDLQNMFDVDIEDLWQDDNVKQVQKTEDEYFERGDKIREGKQHRKRRAAVSGHREDIEFYSILIFKSQPDRDSFFADFDIEDSKYVNGEEFKKAVSEGMFDNA